MPHSPDRPVLHVEHTGSFILPLPLEKAFRYFTPEGERFWVPGWDPEYLHPDHPATAVGTVFRTTHHGEETLWLILGYDPVAGFAEYVRDSPGSRIGTVQVQCERRGTTETEVQITYRLTALSPEGRRVLKSLDGDAYQKMLAEWQALIMRAAEAAR